MAESITIPRSLKSVEAQLTALGDLILARKWERSALVASVVRLAPGRGRSPSRNGELTISVENFAAKGIHGLTHPQAVRKYVQAWLDTHEGEYPEPGRKVTLPDVDFPPTRTGTDGYETESGAAATVTKLIKKKHGTAALASAVKNDPEVAAAAAQALVDSGDITRLSQATAKVAQNRQVERTRRRREDGVRAKARTVQDPKPSLGDSLPAGEAAGLNAFLNVKGLADALRALVTTFPQEWAALSDLARQDEDFVGVCEETLDKIDMASAHCRSLISGGVTDAELQSILDGGE
jgi:hypothetical protein